MNAIFLQRIIFSLIALGVVFVFSQFLRIYAKKTQDKFKIHKSRYYAIKRFISIFAVCLFLVLLVFIWGINLKNVWASLTAILAMIAVAFFAVWSLVGNILAGVILFFTSPFKINNEIEVLPDGIKGKVLSINAFYTLLTDEDDNYINIPNSLFFQKYVRNIKPQKKASAPKVTKS